MLYVNKSNNGGPPHPSQVKGDHGIPVHNGEASEGTKHRQKQVLYCVSCYWMCSETKRIL